MTTSSTPDRRDRPADRWFRPAEPLPEARVRLFLLPHAGGGAASYRGWERLLPAEVGAQAMTLPGRQQRRPEPLPADWKTLLEALHRAMLTELDERPYALFGHCLGAQLAYRLAVRMERDGEPAPVLLGVSGWAPHGFFRAPADYQTIPDEEAAEWVKGLGAVPAVVLADPEMLEVVLPPVMADFRLAAQHHDDEAVVESPLVSYGGRSDELMQDPDAMKSWAGRSRRYLGHNEFPGGHFFVYEHAREVASDFAGRLIGITRGV